MTGSALLLAPSNGLGGGIERYLSTVESALEREAVGYRRLDLLGPDLPGGRSRRVAFAREVRRAVRTADAPVRLILGHRNLLPVLRLVRRLPAYAGAALILHGSEVWSGRARRGARLMRRPEVRVVAASSFTAGAVSPLCPAGVLPPGVPAGWYATLVAAGVTAAGSAAGGAPRHPEPAPPRLVTAFRLASWREKGLPVLLAAIERLGGDPVRLTVCGSGPAPAALRAAVAARPWCELAADLTDRQLADRLAGADLFVLCTRTRSGAAACGEGFGLVLLEAQLAGTPVVAPAFGGSAEAYLREVTGVAPVDESAGALAAVLRELLADPARRDDLARAAAGWSRTRFEPAGYGRFIVQTLLGTPADAPAQATGRSGGGAGRTAARVSTG